VPGSVFVPNLRLITRGVAAGILALVISATGIACAAMTLMLVAARA
jgi:hypothetical protein